MPDQDVTRRGFIRSTAGGAAAAGVASSLFAAPAPARAAGAGERLRIGFIGPGGRGFGAHIGTLAKLRQEGAYIDLAAVSEVYSVRRDEALNFIQQKTGVAPKKYDDYRDMLADEAIDAVAIATPDHWHARQAIDALRAGKHV